MIYFFFYVGQILSRVKTPPNYVPPNCLYSSIGQRLKQLNYFKVRPDKKHSLEPLVKYNKWVFLLSVDWVRERNV